MSKPFHAPNISHLSGVAGIYKFTNKVNGKIYVGQSKNVYVRYGQHRRMRTDSLITRAIAKHGIENFDFELLEEVKDIKLLTEREQYYLDLMQAYNPKIGYNIETVANKPCLGRKLTKIEIARMHSGLKAFKEKFGHPSSGRKMTDYEKAALIERQKGKRPSLKAQQRLQEVKRKPIVQINIATGQPIKIWDYSGQAVDELGLSRISLQSACNGGKINKCKYGKPGQTRVDFKNGIYKGFRWMYLENYKSPLSGKAYTPGSAAKKVQQIDILTGEVIRVWDKAADAAKELDLVIQSIRNCCRGKRYNYYKNEYVALDNYAGYGWQYAE